MRKPGAWPPGPRAFSLVEVILALGIATFAIVSIVALLPIGLQSSRDSLEESAALNLLSSIVADRQATAATNTSAIYGLPALTTNMTAVTQIFGIADTSQATNALNKARYRVTCTFSPPAPGTRAPYVGVFKASWPALDTNAANSVETVATFPQP